MSIIWSNELGWILCHSQFLYETFGKIENVSCCSNCGRFNIFHIGSQFLRPGQKSSVNPSEKTRLCDDISPLIIEAKNVKQNFETLATETKCQKLTYFRKPCPLSQTNNSLAVDTAQNIFKTTAYTKNFEFFRGGNTNKYSIVATFHDQAYLIPPSCSFFNCDVTKLADKIKFEDIGQFDVILLDPPWWNKHIRRKNSFNSCEGYELMQEKDLLSLPVNQLLSSDGLVAVWCTNSRQQLEFLVEKVFACWGIRYISTWYWVKVTGNFEPVCKFPDQPGQKQPFEKIIFGCRVSRSEKYKNPEAGKLIISIPSSIHSHKPPLAHVLTEYTRHGSQCLELFARYLIPNWTSCGNEVLKLQHKSVFA